MNLITSSPSLTVTSASFKKTREIGQILSQTISKGISIGLLGELGAGKTQFVKGIARGLNIDEDEVVSPSFGLINEYKGDTNLYHVDLYRLDAREEIDTLGLEDYFGGDGIVVVEWAERLHESDLALFDILVKFRIISENQRDIIFYGDLSPSFTEITRNL